MNTLQSLRTRVSFFIVALLWVDVALVLARQLMRADGADFAALAMTVIVALAATACWNIAKTAPLTRIVTSMAHAAVIALLVYSFDGSSLQIDIHMYFFASLAVCAAWIDWRAIVGYAALVAVHHLLVYFAMPLAVFPGSSDFSRVLLHAVVLITQSGALIALTTTVARAFETADTSVEQANAAERSAVEMAERVRQTDAAAAHERRKNDEMRDSAHRQITFAVDNLRTALSALSNGDVTSRISAELDGDLNELRNAFNQSARQLESVLKELSEVSHTIRHGTAQISDANNELSRRTEMQAAELSDTARDLAGVVATVRETSSLADRVATMVNNAQQGAEGSSKIMIEAMTAMQRIENSSSEIGNIIAVIDEIAFQTNLLALNAGVEAARAGDAGKGFAVVAQEVRELAQRSANAAKEIKTLINSSTDHVKEGVSLVAKTGDALDTIASDVSGISSYIADIVNRAREQSSRLDGLGHALTDIDRNTQQNAAMVEESSGAITSMAHEAERLDELVRRFKVNTALNGRAQGARAA